MSQEFTPEEIIKELKREIGQRLYVYPRQVEQGKMTQALMDKRIALLEAAVDLIVPMATPSLFPEGASRE